MRKYIKVVVFMLTMLFVLSACTKSKEQVLTGLNDKVEDLTSYKAQGTLTMKTGATSETYHVEVLHKKPAYYKVTLKNKKKGQSQIILRNKEGVFVLTPALNKSFKFQSDWPLTTSQVYLYESLVKDILLDKNASFTAEKDNYLFEVSTNYQSSTALPSQKIVLNKKSLAPKLVTVFDGEKNPLIEVKFTKFEFDVGISKKAFDTKENMKNAQKSEVPTLAQEDNPTFSVLYPKDSALPRGTVLKKEQEVETEDGSRFILSYGDEKTFTLLEEKAVVAETSTPIQAEGEPIDLGLTIGMMTTQAISWTMDGVDYLLASEDLSQEEMIAVASSIGQTGEK